VKCQGLRNPINTILNDLTEIVDVYNQVIIIHRLSPPFIDLVCRSLVVDRRSVMGTFNPRSVPHTTLLADTPRLQLGDDGLDQIADFGGNVVIVGHCQSPPFLNRSDIDVYLRPTTTTSNFFILSIYGVCTPNIVYIYIYSIYNI